MGTTVYLSSPNRNNFVEASSRLYYVPSGYSETPPGSGLYDPESLVETPPTSGLYSIPANTSRVAIDNLHSFSVQEDATPIDPSSSAGGVGTLSVTVDDYSDIDMATGGLVFTDGSRGKTSGFVRDISTNDGLSTVTADSSLGLFNTVKTALPFVGTFAQAVQYYCDLVGIPNDVVVDASIASRNVVYPGWTGNAWARIKEMLAAEQVEMALVFDRIYVRPLRLLAADQERLTSSGRQINSDGAARAIEIYYYNHIAGSQLEVYPPATLTEPQIIVVNANETQVISQQLESSLSSVNQPVASFFVDDTSYAGTDGVYAVTGVDELPIQPAQWLAAGGSLTVATTNDPSVIEITVRGANIPALSPFRIAMSSGSSNFYNSLHITGSGVNWDKKLISIPTGTTSNTTATDVGVTVDNPFIRTLDQAYTAGIRAAGSYAGINYTVSGNAYALNRAGDDRSLISATVADFNAKYLDDLISDFNSLWAGSTFADFDEYWRAQVDLTWENQLFGNAPGARILKPDANFRVENATTNETSVQFNARLDTVVGDFNTAWTFSGYPDRTNRAYVPIAAAASSPWLYQSGTGEAGTSSVLSSPGDGPEGRTTSFVRRTITAPKTGGGSGWFHRTVVGSGPSGDTGEAWSAGMWLRASHPVNIAFAYSFRSGSTSLNTKTAPTVAVPANTWTWVTCENAISSGAFNSVQAWPTIPAGSILPVGGYIDVTDVLIERGSSLSGPYFDGSYPGALWNGPVNASTSSYRLTPNIEDFNREVSGYTCKDFSIVPLRRTAVG